METKKATFTRENFNSVLKSAKEKAEIAKLAVILGTVKTVEYSVKAIIKTEEIAKETIDTVRSKTIELDKWFTSRDVSKLDLLTIIIEIIIYIVSVNLVISTGSIIAFIVGLLSIYFFSYNMTVLFMNIALNRPAKNTVRVQVL